MYAVVRAGGKQLRVEPGDEVLVEKLPGQPGERVELPDVLMIGGTEAPAQVRVGSPRVEGARVVATIQGDAAGSKIRIFKYRRRKRYRLRKGHRQHYTRIRIDAIEV
jgi:large subunit ribosomal protein L21